ncbi:MULTISPECIES: hypothetical protein [unclassified Paenibacillus]|uniref:hypothetical protein n=1 Tax=unclassified Paenibacillus TaxID=185978 RepID=UPI003645A33A
MSTVQITMAEALSVRAAIGRKLHQLFHERNMNSTSIIEKGETADIPARSVDVLTREIEAVNADFRKIDVLLAKANIERTIVWDGQPITILEAIELAKQTRMEIQQLGSLGNRKKLERQTQRSGFGEGATSLFTVALYDPESYRNESLKKEREVTKLSSLIEQSNHLHYIDFDASAYMG